MCVNSGPIQWWSSHWSYCSGSHGSCLFIWRVCCRPHWWIACPCGGILKQIGQWKPSETDWLPSHWSSSIQTAHSWSGNWNVFSMSEFIINCLKGAEFQDWTTSRFALRRAILLNDLTIPYLVDIVADIIGVWPLFVAYFKETGQKDDGDNLVVSFFPFFWSDYFLNSCARVSCILNFLGW